MIRNIEFTCTRELIDFVDKLATYDLVFNEYIETMRKINDGRALLFENFRSLSINYRKNVQSFAAESLKSVKLLKNKIDTESLCDIANGLNKYIQKLNSITTCIDIQFDNLDLIQHSVIANDIKIAKNNLIYSLQNASY